MLLGHIEGTKLAALCANAHSAAEELAMMSAAAVLRGRVVRNISSSAQINRIKRCVVPKTFQIPSMAPGRSA
jgi:hypothetical protein